MHDRLRQARHAPVVVVGGLAAHPQYPCLSARPLPRRVTLDEPANSAEVRCAMRAVVAQCRKLEATLLVLPELVADGPAIDALRTELAQGGGTAGHPVLTIVGKCHCRGPGTDVNEAVLLGPDGTDLHVHRKLAPFRMGADGATGEYLDLGREIAVLESDLGNLVPLICLDVLNESLLAACTRTHGSVFLVPSMSRETNAHRTSAQRIWRCTRAATFSANWWFEVAPRERTSVAAVRAASFWLVGGRQHPARGSSPLPNDVVYQIEPGRATRDQV